MATTIVTKSGSGAPTASDLVAGELAVDLTNKRLYTEDSGGTVLEVGSNPYNFTANHDGSAKLATTATGIDVTGSVTADGLTVDTDTLVVDATNNRVGIGTSSPSSYNSAGNDLVIASTSAGLTIASDPADSGHILFADSTTGTGAYTGFIRYDHTTDSMRFAVNAGVEAMRIDASGNVLIGTSNSLGVLTIKAPASDDQDIITITEDGINQAFSINGNFAGSGSTGNAITLDSYWVDDIISFSGDGKVGIGTSSPATTLHITKDGNQSAVLDAYEAQQVSHNTIAYTRWVQNASGIANIMGVDSAAGILGTSSNHALVIRTNNTERMRIDGATGDVGIGTSSPTSFLGGKVTEITNSATAGEITDNQDLIVKSNRYSAISVIGKNTGGSQLNFGDSDNREVGGFQYDHTNDYLITRVNGAERSRIDASGNLLVGKTSDVNTANGITLRPDGGARFTSAGTGAFVQLAFFRNGAAGEVGSISTTSSATSYVTSSDQRLKENIADADDAGSKIDAIQVRKYDWKADGSHQDYGLVAQELQPIAPLAVSGDADSEEMMGVDYSKLVPMMLKEIQSLRARINAIESK